MIDVVFLLLIFFVCTASFQIAEAVLPSPLASSGAVEMKQPSEPEEIELERVLIEIVRGENDFEFSVNGQPCPSLVRLGELLAALAAIDRTLPVILDIDGQTPLGIAIDVYDHCLLAEFERIQFAVKHSL